MPKRKDKNRYPDNAVIVHDDDGDEVATYIEDEKIFVTIRNLKTENFAGATFDPKDAKARSSLRVLYFALKRLLEEGD